MIELYSRATPNGRKIAIALEEMGLPYRVHAVDFANLQQKSPEFLTLNPNGRIPVIVDTAPAGGGSPVTVFESGAILLYLAEKSGKLQPVDPVERIEMLKWLFFGASQVTHTAMQVHWLVRLQEKGAAAPHLEDYRTELRRLYGVLDGVLTGRQWLAGGTYSIADIASWTWIERHQMHGIVIESFPALTDWFARVGARPATQKGYDIPPRQN
ncbi:MAG: GST-like protein [Alphaproteobacteria bacterium]|jgi:GST-like protein